MGPHQFNALNDRLAFGGRRRPYLWRVLNDEVNLPASELLPQVAQVLAFDDHDALGQEELNLLLADVPNLHEQPVREFQTLRDFRPVQPSLHVAGLPDAGRQEPIGLVDGGIDRCIRAAARGRRLNFGEPFREGRLSQADCFVQFIAAQVAPPG